jgi:DNA polymerase III alpha subunit
MARAARVATVATGDVLYHAPARRILQDVLTCIRKGCTIDDARFRRERSADRHLKAPERWCACAEGVDRAGADVAEHHAERAQVQGRTGRVCPLPPGCSASRPQWLRRSAQIGTQSRPMSAAAERYRLLRNNSERCSCVRLASPFCCLRR